MFLSNVLSNTPQKGTHLADGFPATLEEEHINEPFGPFFEEIRSYASACLMSSVASLEALINEFFIAHQGKLRPLFNNFENEFWGRGSKNGIERKPILDKYQLALQMLKVKELDKKSTPYRDTWALIELRNALIHYKPTWDPDRRRKVDLVDFLDGRFGISPFSDAHADFVSMKCVSAGCTKWAVSTMFSFMHKFHDRADLDSNKMTAFWELEIQ